MIAASFSSAYILQNLKTILQWFGHDPKCDKDVAASTTERSLTSQVFLAIMGFCSSEC